MASWFLDLNSAKRLDLNPPYQRRSVWNDDFRKFFIDSLIRNYPTQAIFIDTTLDPDIATSYKVLDGKQRLTSLIMFVNNELITPDSLTDLGLDNQYYSDLPRDVKTQILSYLFTVETVTNASPADLNQAFDRLNRNVLRLNKQELRHAQYAGSFILKMEKYAEDPFWEDIGLVTPARRRRMLDVEYSSEFYIVAADGIQDGKDYLDEYYANWDDEIPREKQTDTKFRKSLRFLKSVNEKYPLAPTRFSNVADFYSVWAAVTELADTLPTSTTAAESLLSFSEELDAQKTQRSRDYLLAARQGSNKSLNRTRRADILKDVLTGK
jgi:uncharacterized protein with ParB-like and HNH nuclease domain